MAYERETILANMATAGATITVANGYLTNAGSNGIKRYPTRPPAEVLGRLFLARTDAAAPLLFLFDGAAETYEAEKSGGRQEQWTLRPRWMAIVKSDASTPSTTLNQAIGDLKKLVAATRQWPTSAAYDTASVSVAVLDDLEPPHAGATYDVEIYYEHADTTP